jgi:hypothetical protein
MERTARLEEADRGRAGAGEADVPLRVSTRDGRTRSFDVRTEEGLERWQEAIDDQVFRRAITAASILHEKVLHTLPAPVRFRRVRFGGGPVRNRSGEIIGEEVWCQADNVRTTLRLFPSRNGDGAYAVRVGVERTGWQRFDASAAG